jgi:hypothetical protein
VGCEGRRAAERRATIAEEAGREAIRRGDLPEALMVRFQEVRGSGFPRQGWEVELLQLGSDVRLRGAIRSGTQSAPVFGTLAEGDYVDLWSWLAGLPLDRLRVVQDSTVAPTDWKKTLEVDVVLGPDRRLVSRNTWTRPALGAPWLEELEARLHRLAIEHAVRPDTTTAADSTREAVEKALHDAAQALDGAPARDSASTGGAPERDAASTP